MTMRVDAGALCNAVGPATVRLRLAWCRCFESHYMQV